MGPSPLAPGQANYLDWFCERDSLSQRTNDVDGKKSLLSFRRLPDIREGRFGVVVHPCLLGVKNEIGRVGCLVS